MVDMEAQAAAWEVLESAVTDFRRYIISRRDEVDIEKVVLWPWSSPESGVVKNTAVSLIGNYCGFDAAAMQESTHPVFTSGSNPEQLSQMWQSLPVEEREVFLTKLVAVLDAAAPGIAQPCTLHDSVQYAAKLLNETDTSIQHYLQSARNPNQGMAR